MSREKIGKYLRKGPTPYLGMKKRIGSNYIKRKKLQKKSFICPIFLSPFASLSIIIS